MSHSKIKINQDWRKCLVEVISDVFNELCWRNDPFLDDETPRCGFHSITACPMKIKPYLMRIANYTGCSNECLLFSLIYIDRLIAHNDNIMVTSYNVHRLALTSILVAAKYYDDHYYNNSFYGQVGGLSCKELNKLEMLFLYEMKFELFVEKRLFERYQKFVNKSILNKLSFIQKSSKISTNINAPIQAFGFNLVSSKLSLAIRKTQNYEYTKASTLVVNSKPRSRNVDVNKNNYFDERMLSQYANIPFRCLEREQCNWQVTRKPLISTA